MLIELLMSTSIHPLVFQQIRRVETELSEVRTRLQTSLDDGKEKDKSLSKLKEEQVVLSLRQ